LNVGGQTISFAGTADVLTATAVGSSGEFQYKFELASCKLTIIDINGGEAPDVKFDGNPGTVANATSTVAGKAGTPAVAGTASFTVAAGATTISIDGVTSFARPAGATNTEGDVRISDNEFYFTADSLGKVTLTAKTAGVAVNGVTISVTGTTTGTANDGTATIGGGTVTITMAQTTTGIKIGDKTFDTYDEIKKAIEKGIEDNNFTWSISERAGNGTVTLQKEVAADAAEADAKITADDANHTKLSRFYPLWAVAHRRYLHHSNKAGSLIRNIRQ